MHSWLMALSLADRNNAWQKPWSHDVVKSGAKLCVLTGAVHVGPADGAHLVVRPVDVSVHGIVVDGDGVADVIQLQHHVRVVRRVQRDAPQVGAPGQQQDLMGACK